MCLILLTVYVQCQDENALQEEDEYHFMGDLAGNFQKILLWYDFKRQ